MSPALYHRMHLLARAGLCLAYVYSGVDKLFDFPSAIAEQQHFGLVGGFLLIALHALAAAPARTASASTP